LIQAARYASYSNCKFKSLRGAALWLDDLLIGAGANYHDDPKVCDNCPRKYIHDGSRQELCRAEHAEMMALEDAKRKEYRVFRGAIMYQMKVKDGLISISDDPACINCASVLAEHGITYVGFLSWGICEFTPAELSQYYQRRNRGIEWLNR